MNLKRVIWSETNTEYAPAELLTARNQRGEIAALVAVERNNRDLHHVRFRLHSIARAVRVFNDGLASVAAPLVKAWLKTRLPAVPTAYPGESRAGESLAVRNQGQLAGFQEFTIYLN